MASSGSSFGGVQGRVRRRIGLTEHAARHGRDGADGGSAFEHFPTRPAAIHLRVLLCELCDCINRARPTSNNPLAPRRSERSAAPRNEYSNAVGADGLCRYSRWRRPAEFASRGRLCKIAFGQFAERSVARYPRFAACAPLPRRASLPPGAARTPYLELHRDIRLLFYQKFSSSSTSQSRCAGAMLGSFYGKKVITLYVQINYMNPS